MLLTLSANTELCRLASGLWESRGSDPWFSLRRVPGGPRRAVIEIAGEDGPIKASIYPSRDGRFTEATRIDLPELSRALVVAHLQDETEAGLRLDPADKPGVRFRLRWWARRSEAGLVRLVRRRLAAHPGLTPVLVGPEAGARAFAPFPRVGLRRADLGERLAQVWEMAAAEARVRPLPVAAAPVVSFLVPVHDTPTVLLDALRDSVTAQGPAAELVLSDDGSSDPDTQAWLNAAPRSGIKVLRSASNRGVATATNAALYAAAGDWVGLLDHDDVISPFAVDRIRRALALRPDVDFIYTDEAILDASGKAISVFCKPAFDPVLLSGVNYVNHLALYRRARLLAIGGLRDGFQGSQDYELVLRYNAGLDASRIVHLPYPAYQWRELPGSLSRIGRGQAVDAARRALAEHMPASLGPIDVEPSPARPELHRVRPVRPPHPLVSVVIPNRDSLPLITCVLADLYERTTYDRLEVVVVDNGSRDPAVLELYRAWSERRGLRILMRPEPFNFAKMVNRGVAATKGEATLLLNNDVSIIHPDWLCEMVECLAFPKTGVVGAKLLYPDRSIQHAGVVLGLGGYAGHWFYKAAENEPGPMGRLAVRNSMTVVTGACLLATRDCWKAVGGMDEDRFAVAYNDVDFCGRVRRAGWGVVWTPFATLIHHESVSRGSDRFGARARRFEAEKAALAALHDTARFEDPSFSPWYSRYASRPDFTLPKSLPEPRSFLGMSH